MRKYELRQICKTLSYAKRIAARMRNAAQKAALRREIAAFEKESIALKRLLARLAERYALRREERKKSWKHFTVFGEILLFIAWYVIIKMVYYTDKFNYIQKDRTGADVVLSKTFLRRKYNGR